MIEYTNEGGAVTNRLEIIRNVLSPDEPEPIAYNECEWVGIEIVPDVLIQQSNCL